MHIHASQLNLNAELYAAQAAARADAKMAAEQTRRKLMSSASALAGEVDDGADCVVRLGGQGEPQNQSNQQDGRGEAGQNAQYAQADTESNPFSGWA